MKATFRPATRADLAFVAWCNYEATSPEPGFSYWDPLLDGFDTDTHAFIRTVFTHDALAWGRVEDFILGTFHHEVVCGASGFVMPRADYRPLILERLPAVANALGWSEANTALFRERYERVWSNPLDETLKPAGEWIIECVAVAEQYRNRGLGKQLMAAVLEAGKQRGHATAGISVTIDNGAADALYKSVGFAPYVTYWPDYFGGYYPGSHKLRKTL